MVGFITLVAASLFWVLLSIGHQSGLGLKSWVGIPNFDFLEFFCFVILGIRFTIPLISNRVYKSATSHAEATLIIMSGRGSQFDPDVFDAFLAIEDSFRQIADLYADRDRRPRPAERARVIAGATYSTN